MPDSATIIRDGGSTHRIQIPNRDWMLLSGPGFAEGPAFISAFGVFEDFAVAGGIPKGSVVHRAGNTLHVAASTLLAGIKRDLELLRYDYSYKIADEPRQYGGGQSIGVGRRRGILSLRPKGYCSIKLPDRSLKPPPTAEVIDLRAMDTIATDSGLLKVYRRRAEIHWPELLPPLLEFLVKRLDRTLIREHIDRGG
ncbi:MAG TPA: hypothetical protein VGQ99_03200 [Tepidisphaeraceae bacterium]|jgi:hypothetical protein|nr:hypothetical protein [Tepidisphaeraceae bacterium]